MQTEMDHSRDQIQKDFVATSILLKHQYYSRRVVTAGDAVSCWHDLIRVPAAAHDMDEAWGRACSTTYTLPYSNRKSSRRNNAAEWNVGGV